MVVAKSGGKSDQLLIPYCVPELCQALYMSPHSILMLP